MCSLKKSRPLPPSLEVIRAGTVASLTDVSSGKTLSVRLDSVNPLRFTTVRNVPLPHSQFFSATPLQRTLCQWDAIPPRRLRIESSAGSQRQSSASARTCRPEVTWGKGACCLEADGSIRQLTPVSLMNDRMGTAIAIPDDTSATTARDPGSIVKRWRHFIGPENLSADAQALRAHAARCIIFFLVALGVALGKPGLLVDSFPYASRPVDAIPQQIGDGHDIWRVPIVSEAEKRVEPEADGSGSSIDGSSGDRIARDLNYSKRARPFTARHSQSASFDHLARAPPPSC